MQRGEEDVKTRRNKPSAARSERNGQKSSIPPIATAQKGVGSEKKKDMREKRLWRRKTGKKKGIKTPPRRPEWSFLPEKEGSIGEGDDAWNNAGEKNTRHGEGREDGTIRVRTPSLKRKAL